LAVAKNELFFVQKIVCNQAENHCHLSQKVSEKWPKNGLVFHLKMGRSSTDTANTNITIRLGFHWILMPSDYIEYT
jgi:hypothetical protein